MRTRFLVLALVPLPLAAQARDSIIAVSSTQTMRIAPDRASFYLLVEGTAETTADALARVNTKLKAVTDALKTFGSRVSLNRPMDYGVGPAPANGYPPPSSMATNVARSIMRVQLNRPEQLAQVIAAALAAGASGSSSLVFESTVADSVRRARIGEVLNSSRLDAEAIANSLGARLGALVSVSVNGPFGYQGPSVLSFDNRYAQPPSQPPEIVVSTNVNVSYRIVR